MYFQWFILLFSVTVIFRSVIGMPFCVDVALGSFITSMLSILRSSGPDPYLQVTDPVPDQDPTLHLLMERLGSGAGSGSCILIRVQIRQAQKHTGTDRIRNTNQERLEYLVEINISLACVPLGLFKKKLSGADPDPGSCPPRSGIRKRYFPYLGFWIPNPYF